MTEAEKKIGYEYKDVGLLENALTHSSYANERRTKDNECLEFLGDSVLSIIVSDYIYRNVKDVTEGDLTKIRAALVCEESLANIAKRIDLGNLIYLGHGEEMSGGRERASIVSDAFEAVLASIYLDGGMEAAREWLLSLIGQDIRNALSGAMFHDYKTMLQEIVQKNKSGSVEYRLKSSSGQDHDKRFTMAAVVNNKDAGVGRGRSKKEAEQNAAKQALISMGKLK